MSIQLKNKKILIISPHPDDEVIGCGGLIALAKKNKCKTHVLYITTGHSRQLYTGSTNSKNRVKEIKSVSNYGNFTYSILFENKYFVLLDTLAQKKIIDPIEDMIEKIRPDIIFLPHGESYNQDHRATFKASIAALRPIPRKLRHYVKTVLIYEEPYSWTIGDIFRPNIYLNTEKVEKEKIRLMKLHKSQDRPSPFSRSTNNLISRMRLRGSEVGLKSAEAYILLRGSLE